MLKPVLSVVAAALLAAGVAVAQAPTAPSPTAPPEQNARGGLLRTACAADIATHCSAVEAGRGRRIACLVEKKAQLTPACQQAVEQRQAARDAKRGDGPRAEVPARPNAAPGEPGRAAGPNGPKGRRGVGLAVCRTDVATHCQGIETGKGGRIACLRQNLDKLDPACRTAVAERTARAQGIRQACQADRQTLCGSVEKGGGRIAACMKANADKLSPGCRMALQQ